MEPKKKKSTKKKKHAGGREPLPEGKRKIRIDVFIEEERVEARGGKKEMQKHLYQVA